MGMKAGLLWYDDDRGRDIEDVIEVCAQRYYEKFGVRPDTCYVNPTTLERRLSPNDMKECINRKQGRTPRANRESLGSPQRDLHLKSNIQVKTAVNILPNHFWLGVARSKTGKDNESSLRKIWKKA